MRKQVPIPSDRDPARPRRIPTLALALFGAGALCVSAAVLLGPRLSEPPDRSPGHLLANGLPASPDFNVILISLDTLRADHLGCYGYPRRTSPNIDRFARGAVLFENTLAQSTWTLPSHASILTGLYPTRHGVRGDRMLDDDLTTLADVLHRNGYRTVAFTDGGWMKQKYNFHTFDLFDDKGRRGRSYERMRSWLAERQRGWPDKGQRGWPDKGQRGWPDKGQPGKFFLFWHSYEVHCPYDPAPEYDLFSSDDYAGPIVTKDKCNDYYDEVLTDLTPTDIEHIVDKYDGGIRSVDRKVGELLEFLELEGLASNTIIILTSDHGETFAAREVLKQIGHGILYHDVLHVPLIIRFPGSGLAGRVANTVETVDIMPTVLEVLGLDPVPDIDGRSLFSALQGEDKRIAYSERHSNHHRKGDEFSVQARHERLVYYQLPNRYELYDVVTDPDERTNLSGSRPATEGRLKEALRGKMPPPGRATGPPRGRPIETDEETREQLRALGYIEE